MIHVADLAQFHRQFYNLTVGLETQLPAGGIPSQFIDEIIHLRRQFLRQPPKDLFILIPVEPFHRYAGAFQLMPAQSFCRKIRRLAGQANQKRLQQECHAGPDAGIDLAKFRVTHRAPAGCTVKYFLRSWFCRGFLTRCRQRHNINIRSNFCKPETSHCTASAAALARDHGKKLSHNAPVKP
ncbi:hypothetical protein SDC9_115854 [bioreactor metagenome]|uniref:Uncharacterized protein n=1 Tax=bioreactor metagenome TaxID=1076179 RepID=A0A645BU20_9ZZZZ